ncbi:hypothetical protein V1264_019425 [Littorina saxatilis]|uniref:Uncharacterized protein n=1 Tax=Littorina saxatilis TaxID=31220 RepID=A0AAN9GDZ9_9CAEN
MQVNHTHYLFGYIFLAWTILVYFISAIKAVRDRKKIKAQIAARRSGVVQRKNPMRSIRIYHDKEREKRLKGIPSTNCFAITRASADGMWLASTPNPNLNAPKAPSQVNVRASIAPSESTTVDCRRSHSIDFGSSHESLVSDGNNESMSNGETSQADPSSLMHNSLPVLPGETGASHPGIENQL